VARLSIDVRPAHESDLPFVLEILNDAIENTTAVWYDDLRTLDEQAAWFHSKRAGGWPVLVADDGGVVAGWGSYGPFRAWPGYRHTVEHSVYVHRDRRGRGIGALILAGLLAEARTAGMHVMVGAIDAANAASIRFHERLGFVETGRMPQVGTKFGRWLDLVLVQRPVDERGAPG
jgi:phosphinothricin acetyltransferase